MTMEFHQVRFPGESPIYRDARNKLLEAEIQLRRAVEAVAAERRQLPLGGRVPLDYAFEEQIAVDGAPLIRKVHLSQLFSGQKDSLIIYSFMFGPEAARPCPSCTSILDALDGEAPHITQRVNLAVVAKSPVTRIQEFAAERGWRNLRLLSSHGTTYNHDYHAENDTGSQMPVLNVFVRRDDAIFHSYSSELLFAPGDPGQDRRHVDLIWPLWNMLDFTPEGRGEKWNPRLAY